MRYPFEIRTFTADGEQDKILHGIQPEFTDEFGTTGYLKMSVPYTLAVQHGLQHRMECALFLEGVEIPGSRALLAEATGNETSGDDAPGTIHEATWGGPTWFGRLEKAVVYPKTMPVDPEKGIENQRFLRATVGTVVKTFLDQAQARGALLGLEYTDWSEDYDSYGVPWESTVTIEYKPGVTLKSVIENLIRLGVLDVKMQGRELRLFNGGTFGRDLTLPDTVTERISFNPMGDDTYEIYGEAVTDNGDGTFEIEDQYLRDLGDGTYEVEATVEGSPVVLRRGHNVSDTPYSESSADIANALLMIGDDGIAFETVDTESVAVFGREETSLSQGSTKDMGTLTTLAESSLSRSSDVKGEYTVKVELETTPWVPMVDFTTGDWVYVDRRGSLERYRVRQISLTHEDERYTSVVTLNDKFAELDLRTASKVEGILGGAGADTVEPATQPDVDETIPNPPEGVGSTSEHYSDPISGASRAAATTMWLPPTENTDGTPVTDLASFDVQEQTSDGFTYTAADSWYPLRVDPLLQARWDRRGKDTENAWMGADGGASVRAMGGMDWFFWSDTYWGTIDPDGTQHLGAIARNSITKSDPTTLNDLTGFFGQRNLLPEATALLTTVDGWATARCTLEMSPGPGGVSGRWLRLVKIDTSTAYTYARPAAGAVVAGREYLFTMKIDPASTATSPEFWINWYDADGADLPGSIRITPEPDGWARTTEIAPAGASTYYIMAYANGGAIGDWIRFTMPGVFETTHALQSWQPPLHSEVQYNEVTNPDGAHGVAGATLRTNHVRNPVLFSDLTDWSAYGSGTEVSKNATQFPSTATATGPMPEVVNGAALAPWFTSLTEAATRSVGVGFIGDSCTETSGDISSNDLSDRYIERTQHEFRKHTAVDGLPLAPDLYYGASTYIPAAYIHNGPVDWVFESADEEKYPISQAQTGRGAGGRFRNLTEGVRASLYATFDRVRLTFGDGGFGRSARIYIDGAEQAVIDTFGHTGVQIEWMSDLLPLGEHSVVVEFVPTDGLPRGGGTALYGADLFNADFDKGVRVYDLSASGKAAQDVARAGSSEVADGLDRGAPVDLLGIMLGFNDAGRTAEWGGPRTSAQFKTDILTTISRARANGFTGPVLLIGQWHSTTLGVTTEPQENYRAKLREVAEADATVAFIDLSTVMPDTDYAPWGAESFYIDGLHPSPKGHARIAEILTEVLTPAVDGFSSVQVIGDGSTADVGVDVRTEGHATPWAVGDSYAGGVLVKAPAGQQMVLRTLHGGSAGLTDTFTATGGWQFLTSSVGTVASGATTAPYMIVIARSATAQEVTFYATRGVISDAPVEGYFDGSTVEADKIFAWTGDPWVSSTTVSAINPTGWTGAAPGAGSTVVFDASESVQGDGSVLFVTEGVPTSNYMYFRFPLEFPAGTFASISVSVKSDWEIVDTLVRPRAGSTYVGGTARAPLTTPDADGWSEIRWFGEVDQAADHLMVVLYGDQPDGARTWITESTVVFTDAQEWHGTPFHGGQDGHNVETEWEGVPHASRSIGTFYNSSSAPAGGGQPGGLLHPGAAGGNLSEYVWVTGAVEAPGNKAWVFCNGMRDRALRVDGPWNFQRNGQIYVAEFDMSSNRLTRWVKWFTDYETQWGSASLVKDGYLYVYGERSAIGTGETYLARVPLAGDPFDGPPDVYDGSGWVSGLTAATPVSSQSTSQGGFTAVREFDGQYIAAHVAGFMDHIDGYSAPAPEGPWSFLGTVMEFAEANSNKYVARFHPQMDDPEKGIALSYSQSGEDVYGVQFARGPAGTAVPLFDEAQWSFMRSVDESPDYRGNLIPGQSYAARVRTRDNSDNVSEWAYGEAITLSGDVEAPPQPATPLVTSHFRGLRIDVSGLSANGAAMPRDFSRFTVHVSSSGSGFTPTPENRVDALITRGGISSVHGLDWGKTYWVKVVAWDTTGNESEPSEAAEGVSERLSDPDLPADLINGAKHVQKRSLSLENFSVGAFGNTIVPNGAMEEWDGASILPTGWSAGWPRGEYTDWDTAAALSVDEANPVSGDRSTRIDVPARSTRQIVSEVFPLVPGDIYYVSMKVRTSRKLASTYLQPQLLMGADQSDINGFGGPTVKNVGFGVSDGGAGNEVVTIEGQVEVPDVRGDGSGVAMRWGAFGFDAQYDGDSGYTAWVDSVEVRQIVGSAALANASINRAKIRFLAVDDARIANVGVGKLVAGELWADITVSSRIMTSKTGQRAEMNRDGFFGFNGTDIEPVTQIRSSDGGMVSRWWRTNTTGTRIEAGTYGIGANSALFSFFPEEGTWQFPPAIGFGGSARKNVNIEGIGIHAGSKSATLYTRHGMQMFGIDQVGGIGMTSGNLLDGTESERGAPININAGGYLGVVDIRGGSIGTTSDGAMLRLSPYAPGINGSNPGNIPGTELALNYGVLKFGSARTGDGDYSIRYTNSDAWAFWPKTHLLFSSPSYRFSTYSQANALTIDTNGDIKPAGAVRGKGFNEAAWLKTQGTDTYYATISYSGGANGTIGIRIHEQDGTQVASGAL